MTPDDIAADRAVIAAATPGPWKHEDGTDARAPLVDGPHRPGVAGFPAPIRIGSNQDAAFVARARTRWPAALDEVERLRAELDKAQCAAVHWRGIVGNLASGGEFAAWVRAINTGVLAGPSFAAAREYEEAVEAYDAHVANPTAAPGFDALVRERDEARAGRAERGAAQVAALSGWAVEGVALDMKIETLTADLAASQREVERCRELITSLLWNACGVVDDPDLHLVHFDSMDGTSSADALRYLASIGRVEIVSEQGRRVVARWKL